MIEVGTIASLWRYPVKSMGGEQVASSTLDTRALHGDRMWAVRDLELDAVTTARRLPALLRCTARFVEEPPAGVGPGDVADVIVTFPDGAEVTSTDRAAMNARLSELAGKPVSLVPLPPVRDKAAYRGVVASKKDLRQQFGIAEDEPLPDLSMFPLSKLARLAVYATPVGIFADAYAVHVLTTASLRTMAAQGGDFDVRRFRPNVVIDTPADGLAEQEWLGGTLRSGGVALPVAIPTVRCTIPLREHAGGVPADPQVMKVVSREGDRCLGVYTDIASGGTLRVGDSVELEAPPEQKALAASFGRMSERIKRNTLRTGNKILPK
ncbi:sulfurase [Nocardioides silvaticus]|uniref:Sulfurase n=1 Tax=Nocardioides silvaticus TaxID=2201891 RepID=A0A316TAM7_9ACTN|nr:MOSC N-terminal beta barrel domain-containing protein [Nocardioides silvaticus]PWN01307.1 sulfurase [Nocardioides silvaticus]